MLIKKIWFVMEDVSTFLWSFKDIMLWYILKFFRLQRTWLFWEFNGWQLWECGIDYANLTMAINKIDQPHTFYGIKMRELEPLHKKNSFWHTEIGHTKTSQSKMQQILIKYNHMFAQPTSTTWACKRSPYSTFAK